MINQSETYWRRHGPFHGPKSTGMRALGRVPMPWAACAPHETMSCHHARRGPAVRPTHYSEYILIGPSTSHSSVLCHVFLTPLHADAMAFICSSGMYALPRLTNLLGLFQPTPHRATPKQLARVTTELATAASDDHFTAACEGLSLPFAAGTPGCGPRPRWAGLRVANGRRRMRRFSVMDGVEELTNSRITPSLAKPQVQRRTLKAGQDCCSIVLWQIQPEQPHSCLLQRQLIPAHAPEGGQGGFGIWQLGTAGVAHPSHHPIAGPIQTIKTQSAVRTRRPAEPLPPRLLMVPVPDAAWPPSATCPLHACQPRVRRTPVRGPGRAPQRWGFGMNRRR